MLTHDTLESRFEFISNWCLYTDLRSLQVISKAGFAGIVTGEAIRKTAMVCRFGSAAKNR